MPAPDIKIQFNHAMGLKPFKLGSRMIVAALLVNGEMTIYQMLALLGYSGKDPVTYRRCLQRPMEPLIDRGFLVAERQSSRATVYRLTPKFFETCPEPLQDAAGDDRLMEVH